jgi:threonyl-tRNA synthetase
VPVMMNEVSINYCKEVETLLHENGFHVEVDLSGNTLNKKVRSGQTLQWNFIFVLGAQEIEDRTVTVRARDAEQDSRNKQSVLKLDEAVEKLIALRKSMSLVNEI